MVPRGWEKRGVTFTHGVRGSCRRGERAELEELEEESDECGESDRADWMMKQAIKFMWGAFENLKVHETLAQVGQPDAHPPPFPWQVAASWQASEDAG